MATTPELIIEVAASDTESVPLVQFFDPGCWIAFLKRQ